MYVRDAFTFLYFSIISALACGFLHTSILTAESSLQQPPTQQHTISAYSEYFAHNQIPVSAVKGKETDKTSPRRGMTFFHESPLAHSSPVQPSRLSSENYSQYSSMIYSRPQSISSTASNSNNTSEKSTQNNAAVNKSPVINDASFSSPFPNPVSHSSYSHSSPLRTMESVGPERPSLVVDTTTPLIGNCEADLKDNIFPFIEHAMSKQSPPLDRDTIRTSTPYNDSSSNEMHFNSEQSKSRSRRGSFNDQYPHTHNTSQYTSGLLGGVAGNGSGNSSNFNNNKNSPSTTVNNVFGFVTVTSNPATPNNSNNNSTSININNSSNSSNNNLRIRWAAFAGHHSVRYPPSHTPYPCLLQPQFHYSNICQCRRQGPAPNPIRGSSEAASAVSQYYRPTLQTGVLSVALYYTILYCTVL